MFGEGGVGLVVVAVGIYITVLYIVRGVVEDLSPFNNPFE